MYMHYEFLTLRFVTFSVYFMVYCIRHHDKDCHAFIGHKLDHQTCLTPEEFKESINGPSPERG